MKPVVYGIPNCDQTQRALAWFAGHSVAVEFHDYKKRGAPSELLLAWMQRVDWTALLNRSGTTWRKLPESVRASVVDAERATGVLSEFPSLIRRPVVDYNGRLLIGFDPAKYAELFLA